MKTKLPRFKCPACAGEFDPVLKPSTDKTDQIDPSPLPAINADLVLTVPKTNGAETYYRRLLEDIANWPRSDRGRRLAKNGLTFWDAMQESKHNRTTPTP